MENTEKNSIFVDRESQQNFLRELMQSSNFLLIQGLPGIGKKSLVKQVLQEAMPLAKRSDIYVVSGMRVYELFGEIEEQLEEFGASISEISKMPLNIKRNLQKIIVIHDLEKLVLDEHQHSFTLLNSLLDSLLDSRICLIMLASRNLNQYNLRANVIYLGLLSADDMDRVFRYWCNLYDLTYEPEISKYLHGYPIAAKFAAELLKDNQSKPNQAFEHLKFISRFRNSILEILLGGLSISNEEKKVFQALSVFRRPFDASLLDRFNIENVHEIVENLVSRFLIERNNNTIYIFPIINDVAKKEWHVQALSTQYNVIAAEYYLEKLSEKDSIKKYEATEEAMYHLMSCGRLNEAKQLGDNWLEEAKAASFDLYKNRDYQRCYDLCVQITKQKGLTFDVDGRALLCLARLNRWRDAKEKLEMLRALGDIPPYFLTGYGEILINKGITSEGLPLLLESIEKQPDSAYLYAAVAEVYFDQRDLERAEQYTLDALKLDENSGRAVLLASRLARAKGELERAFLFARIALDLEPKHSHNNFKKLRSALRKKYDGKIPDYLLDDDFSLRDLLD